MLQLNWLRQSHHARRLGFVRSLQRRSLNNAPSAEILEQKCLLSAINTLAVLSDDAPAEAADDNSPVEGDIAVESEDLADWKFEVCDFLMVEDGEIDVESGEVTDENSDEFHPIRYSFGMNFRGGVTEGDETDTGDGEVIEGELADEFETVEGCDPESGEQIKVIYYFGMSGGNGSEKGDDSELEVTDLEAIDGYVDDVTLMQKEDYVFDDMVAFDDFGAAESGLADSGPNPMLFRNLSFGGVPNFAGATASVVEQTSAPAAASNTESRSPLNVSNSLTIPVTSGSNNSAANLFASQNVISSAPVVLAQLNDGTRQESTENGSELRLDRPSSAESFSDNGESKVGKSKESDASDSTIDLLMDNTVRDLDLKKVDDYLQQIGDESRSEPQVVPATETSVNEDQNTDIGRTVNVEDNGRQHRRQVTDSKITESESRTEAIRVTQKQLSENQARKQLAKPTESIHPV